MDGWDGLDLWTYGANKIITEQLQLQETDKNYCSTVKNTQILSKFLVWNIQVNLLNIFRLSVHTASAQCQFKPVSWQLASAAFQWHLNLPPTNAGLSQQHQCRTANMQTIEVHVVGNLCFWGSFSLPQLVPTVNSFFTFNLCQLSTVSSRNFPVLVTPLACCGTWWPFVLFETCATRQ